MNYTLAHLKIAHYVGSQNVPFEEAAETIALLERNGIIDAEGNWSIGSGQKRGLKDSPASVTAWFYGTGKSLMKSGQIKKNRTRYFRLPECISRPAAPSRRAATAKAKASSRPYFETENLRVMAFPGSSGFGQ
jgi:hypothetical protein